MLGPDKGELRHMRESERELLYRIMSELFPNPDNQPDCFDSHIPFLAIVSYRYAPLPFSTEPEHLSGRAS